MININKQEKQNLHLKQQLLLQRDILDRVIFSWCLLGDLESRTENTAALFFGEKNVIWANKLWAAVYLKRNIKGPEKSSQLNFPTKSLRRFRFNIAASCDSHVKGISEMLLLVTHRREGERTRYVGVTTLRFGRARPPITSFTLSVVQSGPLHKSHSEAAT